MRTLFYSSTIFSKGKHKSQGKVQKATQRQLIIKNEYNCIIGTYVLCAFCISNLNYLCVSYCINILRNSNIASFSHRFIQVKTRKLLLVDFHDNNHNNNFHTCLVRCTDKCKIKQIRKGAFSCTNKSDILH